MLAEKHSSSTELDPRESAEVVSIVTHVVQHIHIYSCAIAHNYWEEAKEDGFRIKKDKGIHSKERYRFKVGLRSTSIEIGILIASS